MTFSERPSSVDQGLSQQTSPVCESVDVTTSSFMAEVIEASTTKIVIVDFWAPWCEPCRQLTPILESVIATTKGAVKFCKVNVDENQAIAAQLRVQSLPTVYVFRDGQPVDGFIGVKSQSEITEMINKLAGDVVGVSIAEVLEGAEAALADGEIERAIAAFQAAIEIEADNDIATAGVLHCMIIKGDYEGAQAWLEALSDEVKNKDAVIEAVKRLEFTEQAAVAAAKLTVLSDAAAREPDSFQRQFDLAEAQYGAGMIEDSIATLLSLIEKDKQWNDEAARTRLLKIFASQGATAPEVIAGRRRLSSILFS